MGICFGIHSPEPAADAAAASDAPAHLESEEIVAVIGHGGSTIKKIEHDSGCKIHIDRGSGSIAYDGSDTAVAAAKKAVAVAVAKAHEMPDYTGPEGGKQRAEAFKLSKKRDGFKHDAKAAYDRGDKAAAHAASVKGKDLDAEVARLHARAAATIFAYRNKGHPETFIDLHGLLVDEALRFLTQRLDTLKQGDLEVVTGAGHHSENHVAKIKPAAIALFKERRLKFSEINAGDVKVHLK
ncbi:2',3'-cyclic-nucleotide 3'-phosphodiesterase [Aureococcus anophagefferens]|nr:2',3'-cyclic-nucleotide 3'-phosphodiesterase [Aureococcus anophagefferens]